MENFENTNKDQILPKATPSAPVRFVESLLAMFVEGPSVYKFNEDSGEYEPFDPHSDQRYDFPPRLF